MACVLPCLGLWTCSVSNLVSRNSIAVLGIDKIQKQKSRLRKRAIINAEKHKRGCCKLCDRVVKEGEECGFDFDHRDPKTKFKYKGTVLCIGHFIKLPQTIFDKQWPLEQAKCDLLCRNCHGLKSKRNRDGYKE